MADKGPTVADLGELELLDRIGARLDPPPDDEIWSGDDAAVVAWESRVLLICTDMLVEGVDFDFSYCSGADIGWKALVVNCSDLAAMGSWPVHAVVSLAMRPDTPVAIFDGILDGLVEASRVWPMSIVGGDLSTATEMCVSVTLTGEPARNGPISRAGAKPGDALCVTGRLGGAAGGLRVLQQGRSRVGSRGRLAERQLRPRARVKEGIAIAEAGATAMIDISDGLAIDLWRLVSKSGVGCEIDVEAIPVDRNLSVLEGVDELELAMIGGEDFELLFSIPERNLERAQARAGIEITRIGMVRKEDRTIDKQPIEMWTKKAWEHLR